MCDTPRTNAQQEKERYMHGSGQGYLELAQQLERALAAALKAKEEVEAALKWTAAYKFDKDLKEAEQQVALMEAECEVMRLALNVATKRAEEAERDRNRYKKAWNEWRSLQTGDVQKLFDAALRCKEAEHQVETWEFECDVMRLALNVATKRAEEAERGFESLKHCEPYTDAIK